MNTVQNETQINNVHKTLINSVRNERQTAQNTPLNILNWRESVGQ